MDSHNAIIDALREITTDLLARVMKLEQRNNDLFLLLKSQKDWSTAESERVDSLRLHIERLDQAYYRVFPERYEQDVRFDDQMSAFKRIDPATPKKP